MSIDEAVDLVIFAFKNAEAGDIMIHKAPACTIGVLAQAIKEIFNADTDIKIIGTRHGEKLYETLLTKEEYAVKLENFVTKMVNGVKTLNNQTALGKFFQETAPFYKGARS
jgi:FlaA1/EpsC-like NDP-sugar epimerase